MNRLIRSGCARLSFPGSGGVVTFVVFTTISAFGNACSSNGADNPGTNGDAESPVIQAPSQDATGDVAAMGTTGVDPNDAGVGATDDSTGTSITPVESGAPDSAEYDSRSATSDSGSGAVDSAVSAEAGSKGVVSLFDGTTLSGWLPSAGSGINNAPGAWNVQDGALHNTGGVRGTLISKDNYGSFRLIFSVRQLVANIHYASVLIWGTRPPPNVDAIGGIQFGVPNGNCWDYRPGKPGVGTGLFVQTLAGLSHTAWSRCEIVADVASGTARMACCALVGSAQCKAVQVLQFHDVTAGKTGPIALQVHSAGTQDEYKDITIEVDPVVKDFITTK